ETDGASATKGEPAKPAASGGEKLDCAPKAFQHHDPDFCLVVPDGLKPKKDETGSVTFAKKEDDLTGTISVTANLAAGRVDEEYRDIVQGQSQLDGVGNRKLLSSKEVGNGAGKYFVFSANEV